MRAVLALALAFSVSAACAGPLSGRTPLIGDPDDEGLGALDDGQPGIRTGGFQLRPSATMSLAYDSNILAASSRTDGEALSIVDAALRAENDPGGKVAVDAGAFLRGRRFADVGDQDTTELGAVGSVTAGLGGADELNARLLAQRRYEDRTDIETPNFERVSYYREMRADLAHTHTFNHLSLRTSVSARHLDYEDSSQSFRDRWFYRGELRASYDVGSGLSTIATAYYSKDDYRYISPLVASAETTGALVGAQKSVTEVIEVELSAGRFERTFAQGLGSISGLTFQGAASWQPTRLTTVRADLRREDEPTRLSGVFGKVRTDSSLSVEHSFARDLTLHAAARLIKDDFATIHRMDTTWFGEAGLSLRVSRHFTVRFEYDYASRRSGAAGESFVRHLLGVSFVGRL